MHFRLLKPWPPERSPPLKEICWLVLRLFCAQCAPAGAARTDSEPCGCPQARSCTSGLRIRLPGRVGGRVDREVSHSGPSQLWTCPTRASGPSNLQVCYAPTVICTIRTRGSGFAGLEENLVAAGKPSRFGRTTRVRLMIRIRATVGQHPPPAQGQGACGPISGSLI
jgi:hypothetical protein